MEGLKIIQKIYLSNKTFTSKIHPRWNQQHEVKVGIGIPKMQDHTCWADGQRPPSTFLYDKCEYPTDSLKPYLTLLQAPNHNKIGATENMINP
jgi:hypothetical protein